MLQLLVIAICCNKIAKKYMVAIVMNIVQNRPAWLGESEAFFLDVAKQLILIAPSCNNKLIDRDLSTIGTLKPLSDDQPHFGNENSTFSPPSWIKGKTRLFEMTFPLEF
jgi:hypothetical protein